MKTGRQMVQDCEALQRLEHLTAENWHDMAEADARLVVAAISSASLTGTDVIQAAQRLLMYTYWFRSYTLAVTTLAARS